MPYGVLILNPILSAGKFDVHKTMLSPHVASDLGIRNDERYGPRSAVLSISHQYMLKVRAAYILAVGDISRANGADAVNNAQIFFPEMDGSDECSFY